jgi:GT2 family glycosyltransferase
VIVKKDILDRCGLFSENAKFRAVEDYHLWLRLALNSNIYYIDEPLIYYRDRLDSVRSEETKISHYYRLLLVFSDIISLMSQTNIFNKYILKTYLQQLFIIKELIKYCITKRKAEY